MPARADYSWPGPRLAAAPFHLDYRALPRPPPLPTFRNSITSRSASLTNGFLIPKPLSHVGVQ